MDKNNGGSLDANVLIRVLTGDIPDQKDKALELINSGRDLRLSDTALIETIFALNEYYGVPRREIVAALEPVKNHRRIIFNRELFADTLKLYQKRPALSIEDCYLSVQAKQSGYTPLWTFDKKLAGQTGGLAAEVP